MGFFGAGHGWGGGGRGKKAPLSKTCHTYPTIIKPGKVIPYLKKKKLYINHVTHSLISILHWKSAKFAISRNTGIDYILMHNF